MIARRGPYRPPEGDSSSGCGLSHRTVERSRTTDGGWGESSVGSRRGPYPTLRRGTAGTGVELTSFREIQLYSL